MELCFLQRLDELPQKPQISQCALLVLTDGLEEREIVHIICKWRQTGFYIRSIGLTSGLVTGSHGILMKPDLTLADRLDIRAVKPVILTQQSNYVSLLETEPRLHQLLQQTLLQGGYVAISCEGERILQRIEISAAQLRGYRENHRILVRDWQQSFDAHLNELIGCFSAP